MERVAMSHSYAHDIETILCRIFSCERMGFGGIVDTSYICRVPFTAALIHGFAYLAPTSTPEKVKEFEDFITSLCFYDEMTIDDLLSFKTKTKNFNGATYELEDENGEEALKKIIDKYRELVK